MKAGKKVKLTGFFIWMNSGSFSFIS